MIRLKTIIQKINGDDINAIVWVIHQLERPVKEEDLLALEKRIRAIKALEKVLSPMIQARMAFDEKIGVKK